jgi:hypothetical protein
MRKYKLKVTIRLVAAAAEDPPEQHTLLVEAYSLAWPTKEAAEEAATALQEALLAGPFRSVVRRIWNWG